MGFKGRNRVRVKDRDRFRDRVGQRVGMRLKDVLCWGTELILLIF